MGTAGNTTRREPWNKGRVRELSLFNLGIDSKLRGCDLLALRVRDVCHGDEVASRAIVMQHKTQRPVQFEITQTTRDALQAWIRQATLKPEDFLFPSRLHDSPHLGTRQYARILGHWVDQLGLDKADYGTHSMRRSAGASARLDAHGLIAKIPRTRRWRVTDYGRNVIGTTMYLREHHFQNVDVGVIH